MNRIDQKFKDLRAEKKKAFVAYITAGDPSLKITEELVPALEKSGADIIELGVPFSDPLADGPTIQAASQRALDAGTTLPKIFKSVEQIRKESQVPLALMMYYNQIFHYGEEDFVRKSAAVGIDGVIIPDLPPEEAETLIVLCRKYNIATIFFVSPTTSPRRMKVIAKASTGFIYYVSVAGVTGARTQISQSYKKQIALTQKITDKPICVGFGVSTVDQVRLISKAADGVIVGSSIINKIVKHTGQKDLVKHVAKHVEGLTQPLR